MKNLMKDWNLFEKSWLVVFTVLIVVLSLIWHDSIVGIICSLTGIWCVILVTKGKISNYYVGIVNVALYIFIAYNNQYYGEVMLNAVYFLPMQFVGWYMWVKHKNPADASAVVVKVLSGMERLTYTGASVLAVVLYGAFLKSIGGAMPYVDAMSTILSVIAMILMVTRYVEQWVLWIVVDVVTIVLWLAVMFQGGNDISMLLMWTAYLINAIYGLYNWIKMYDKQNSTLVMLFKE